MATDLSYDSNSKKLTAVFSDQTDHFVFLNVKNVDNEDLELVNVPEINTIQFKDRNNTNKRGYKIIRENFDFQNIPVDYNDSIWEIRYTHDLQNGNFSIPENVTLKFNGGKITNYGIITFNNTIIEANPVVIFDTSGAFNNANQSLINEDIYLEWFGRNLNVQATEVAQFVSNNFKSFTLLSNQEYLINGLEINNTFKIRGNNATIKHQNDSSTYIINIKSNFITIEDVNFDLANTDNAAIQVTNGSENLSIKNCNFTNFTDTANSPIINGSSGVNANKNITIEGCNFSNANDLEFPQAIIIYNADNLFISNNNFSKSGGISIVFNSDRIYNDIKISNNAFDQVQNGNIIIRSGSVSTINYVDISHNTFKNACKTTGKFCINVAENIGSGESTEATYNHISITNNSGNSFGGGGIKVGEPPHIKCMSVIVSANSFSQLQSNNVPFTNKNGTGYFVRGIGNYTLQGNIAKGFGKQGIWVIGVNTAIIEGNVVDTCCQLQNDPNVTENAGIKVETAGYNNTKNIIISNNVSKSNGVDVANSIISGIAIDSDQTINDILISNNICTDERNISFQIYGIRLGGVGAFQNAPKNIICTNNILSRNKIGPIQSNTSGVEKNYIVKNNIVHKDISYSKLEQNNSTPSVKNGNLDYHTNNSVTTRIRNFIDGYVGQEIYISVNDSNTIFDFSSPTSKLFGNNGVDYTASINDWIKGKYISQGRWNLEIYSGQ